MRRVIVTGANGFLGLNTVRAFLESGWHVTGIVRKADGLVAHDRLNVIVADLNEPGAWQDTVRSLQWDTAVHLAWNMRPGHIHSWEDSALSLWSSMNLFHGLSSGRGKMFIGIGTCLEYGPTETDHHEGEEPVPQSPYATAKQMFRLIAHRRSDAASFQFAWLRVFYLYGPYEQPARLVPRVIRGLMSGEAVTLDAANRVVDYLDVRDAARAIVAVADSRLTGVTNVCSGSGAAVGQVAKMLASMLGAETRLTLRQSLDPRYGPPIVMGTNAKLAQATGWRPQISLDQGLRYAIQWWKRPG